MCTVHHMCSHIMDSITFILRIYNVRVAAKLASNFNAILRKEAESPKQERCMENILREA